MGEHLIDGEFQSDKYPTCPRGKLPLSLKDPMAQDLIWEYAQRRRPVDPEFSADVIEGLRLKGYLGPGVQAAVPAADSSIDPIVEAIEEFIEEKTTSSHIHDVNGARERLRVVLRRVLAPTICCGDVNAEENVRCELRRGHASQHRHTYGDGNGHRYWGHGTFPTFSDEVDS